MITAEANEEQPSEADSEKAHLAECKAIYLDIAKLFPTDLGKALSKKERDDKELKVKTLVYGEVNFDSLANTFTKIKSKYGKPYIGDSGSDGILQSFGGKFYDLGCGTGKVCFAAAILHNFEVCVGIELLEKLHEMSCQLVNAYNIKAKTRLPRDQDTEIVVKHGDFLNRAVCDWTDGDVIFANTVFFTDELYEQLTTLALLLRKGAIFICFTKPLPTKDFVVLERELQLQSWGSSSLYILQKATPPRKAYTTIANTDD